MKTFFSISLILFSLFNCHSLKVPQKDKIWGIVIEREVPDFYFDSSKNEITWGPSVTYFTRAYYYKNQILLQSSYEYRNLNFTGLKGDETLEYSKNVLYKLVYFSFVYSNESKKGWLCDSNDVRSARIADRDSLLSKEWIVLSVQHDIMKENEYTLISSTPSNDGTVTEQYRLRGKADTTRKGSVTYVFSNKKFGPTELTLGKEIEQQKKMRVVKMTTITDARHIPPTNTYMRRSELSYELKELAITNEKELIQMFQLAQTALQ